MPIRDAQTAACSERAVEQSRSLQHLPSPHVWPHRGPNSTASHSPAQAPRRSAEPWEAVWEHDVSSLTWHTGLEQV